MTPEQAISALDRALNSCGEFVTLRRVMQHQGQPSSNHDVTVRVVPSGALGYDFGGGVQMDRSSVVLSPTEMVNNQWSWPAKRRDIMIIDDRARVLEECEAIRLGGVIVRYNITLEEIGGG